MTKRDADGRTVHDIRVSDAVWQALIDEAYRRRREQRLAGEPIDASTGKIVEELVEEHLKA